MPYARHRYYTRRFTAKGRRNARKRNAALYAFFEDVVNHFFAGESELDYDGFLQIAESNGLIKRVPYSASEHADVELPVEVDEGDTIYLRTELINASVRYRNKVALG